MSKLNNKSIRILLILFSIILILLFATLVIPQIKNLKDNLVEESIHYKKLNGQIFLPESSPLRESILVEKVSKQIIQTEITAPASVEAKPSMLAKIFPPAGGRIVKLFVNIGQSVKTGQALFEIYSPEVAEIQTEFINVRSSLAQAERELRRKEDLQKKGIIPLRELEESKTAFEIAQSEMEGALLKLKIMGIDISSIGKPLIVRSPINGRVVDLNISPGEFISEPEEPLIIIADLSKVWITAKIQEKDIRFIKPELEVFAKFPAYPDEIYQGKVLFISDILNIETRTTKVIIEFENENLKLKPGMFATVKVLSEPKPEIVIEPKAILQRRDYNYVYVQKEPYFFEFRKIITGEIIDNKIVITEGLTENDYIITKNAIMLP